MNINLKKGFTLVELLIVIAILGTLAVVVLIALNPVQQLARTRDAGRQSTVTQLGHAMEAWATVHGGVYPSTSGTAPLNCANGGWIQNCLVLGGEIQTVPSAVAYSSGTGGNCTTSGTGNVQNGFCYEVAGGNALIFAQAEALSNRNRCTGANIAYFVYSSADGRGGIICSGNPNPGAQTFVQ